MLKGKGLWAYRRSELDRALQIAPEMNATHIFYKVGQGGTYYPGMAQVAEKVREAGFIPFGWLWLLLDDPRAEAEIVSQTFADGFEGFIFDTEASACRNRFGQAERLGQYVRMADIDLTQLYNCSFPNISHHRDLPYDQMNTFCKGGLMPMSYGTFFAPGSGVPPEQQAERVIDEWTYGHYEYWTRRWGFRPPLYPVLGPYHDEHGNVRMPPEEFQVWVDALEDHQPSFFSVFTAAVINDDLLPLLAEANLGEPSEPVLTGVEVRVDSPDVGYLNVRPVPSTSQPRMGTVNHGTVLIALGEEDEVRSKVGQQGEWLHVRLPNGDRGYVAAWYIDWVEPVEEEDEEEEEAPAEEGVPVLVVSPAVGFLNVRPGPSTSRPPRTRVDDGETIQALEPKDQVEAKAGQHGEWLRIRTPEGVEGYVAAWYIAVPNEVSGEPIRWLRVDSEVGLNVRRGPWVDPPIWRVPDGTPLKVMEDPTQVTEKVGQDEWIEVHTPSLHQGVVNGLYVHPTRRPDRREPVNDSQLPAGESAWIFGIHAAGATTAANFRHLFEGTGRTGWVLFTEAIGADPNHGGGHDYSSWSENGFGVIVRLNNGYEPAGTLPVQSRYDGFARACAEYVRNSRGCHIWIIGNEQNNVREHPGGADHPREHITPEMYAQAYNLARREIHAVQVDSIVVAGAVDPYNTYPWALAGGKRWRPLDYFKHMLDHIVDLDGIALHAYTHWMDPDLITAKSVFQDPFLEPGTKREHYYDFQAYRPFAEAIPEKWNDRPIYITESNHWVALDHQPTGAEDAPLGWLNRDSGWVQAAYAEIDRWNDTPYVPQIHCLLLYRWTGDAWAIERLDRLHQDFRQALRRDYRWRR